jgi:hypothetical protein
MFGANHELTGTGPSMGTGLGPLHPDWPIDRNTDRFHRKFQHAVKELVSATKKLEAATREFERTSEESTLIVARKLIPGLKICLNKLVSMVQGADDMAGEGSQEMVDTEELLSQVEGRLCLMITSPVTATTGREGPGMLTSGDFWEATFDGLLLNQCPDTPEPNLGLYYDCLSDEITSTFVDHVSQVEKVDRDVTSGESALRCRSNRSSAVLRASSRRNFVAAQNKVDWVAREAEAQIQSEEVRFCECTLAAKNQAQVAVAQAQERAQAAEAEEARNRIRLNLLRFEVQATRRSRLTRGRPLTKGLAKNRRGQHLTRLGLGGSHPPLTTTHIPQAELP